MLSEKKIIMGVLMGVLLATPFATGHAGIFDWLHHLFGKKHKTVAMEKLEVSKLDSSSKWQCKIGGGCKGSDGLCCASGMKSHLNEVENIEKVEIDKETGLVVLTIKKDAEVIVKDIQEVLGGHWSIKTIEKTEEEG